MVSGIGIGLRMELAGDLLERRPPEVEWLELHPENYLERGGRYRALLKRAQDAYPLVTHGLTFGFCSSERADPAALSRLREFLRGVEAPWHSDHLCVATSGGAFFHDLMPVALSEETLRHATARVLEAKDSLGLEIAVENISYYAPSGADEMDEATFVSRLCQEADCKLLLDVNNVYVNSRNHGFDPRDWLAAIDPARVIQIHVAGHLLRSDGLRIDTHGESVCDDVFEFLEETLGHTGDVPVLLERDGNFPPLDDLLEEVRRLSELRDRALKRRDER